MQKTTIIGRMKAGWHANYSDGGFSSGGRLATYLEEASPGSLVFDASAAPDEACARLVVSGPMLKAGLEGVERFRDQATASRMLPLLEGGFQCLVEANLAGDGLASYSSFDFVGWAEYRRLLETELPAGSVRFGKVVVDRGGHAVEWESFVCDNHSEVPHKAVIANASNQPLCPWCHTMLKVESET